VDGEGVGSGAGSGSRSGWFDSHCHVQEEYLGGEGPEYDIGAVLDRSAAAGVDRLVCIGTGVETSAGALAVARGVSELGCGEVAAWASIGLHPHEASLGVDGVSDLLRRETANGDGALVAVGECGLDYYYEHSPRPAQRAAFAAQIELAHTHQLTLVIHARDAWDDLFDILEAVGVPERTVLHCFTGGPDEVERCLRAGMYVSFSGIVTFKNAADVRSAAARCPLDRLLVETDSPFLAPVPHRGRTNEPAYVPLVGAAVAEVKGCALEQVRESSAAAAALAFAIPT
jgi:TatD DNase family protein